MKNEEELEQFCQHASRQALHILMVKLLHPDVDAVKEARMVSKYYYERFNDTNTKHSYSYLLDDPESVINNFFVQPYIAEKYGLENLITFKMKDKSMNKVIPESSTVIVYKTDNWNDGDLCAVSINEQMTIKKVYKNEEGFLLDTESYDRFYDYEMVRSDEVKIIGRYLYAECPAIEII